MAHPDYIREKAVQMRVERKLTIDEIAERLALPRTTIFYWVKDIPIDRKPNTSWPSTAQKLGNAAMVKKHERLRNAAYWQGLAEFFPLREEAGFRDFVVLYIAEGYKRNRNHVSICNSDPAVMQISLHWLRRLTTRNLRFAIQFHADQDLAQLRRFWGNELRIDGNAIKFQRKSNSGRLSGRTWRSQHGVLKVEAGDTYLRARLQAWMDCVRDEWSQPPS